MRTRRFVVALCLAALPGCEIQQLSQEHMLDRLRILAVRAEPAEPQPGETVIFESFLYVPPDMELDTTIWFACLPESTDDFGCTVDESVFAEFADADFENMTPEQQLELYQALVDAGLIGIEPMLPPSWTTPADALDGMDEIAAKEGVTAMVTLQAIPAGAIGDLGLGKDDGGDGREATDIEIAFKRLPISLADTPNHNPEIVGWSIDGSVGEPDGTAILQAGATYEIEPLLSDASIETYLYTFDDGSSEERTEEPYFAWYIEAGELYQSATLYPTSAAEWTAPATPWEGAVRAVVRDRRGGMNWATLDVVVE